MTATLRPLWLNGKDTGCRIRVAERWWQRAIGLLATPENDEADGLSLAPCNSVHMFGMRYAIDVVYLSAQGRVLKVVHRLGPMRMSACFKAHGVVELRAGLAARLGVAIGDELHVAGAIGVPALGT